MEVPYIIEKIETADGLARVTMHVDAEHPICKAHFPGHPITPGAVLIAMAIDAVSTQKGEKCDADELRNVKFLHPHNPKEQPALTFTFDAAKSLVDVSVMADETVVAKMSLVMK